MEISDGAAKYLEEIFGLKFDTLVGSILVLQCLQENSEESEGVFDREILDAIGNRF